MGKYFIHRFFEYFSFFCGVFFYILRKKRNYDLVISLTTPPLIGFFVALALGKTTIPYIYYIEDLYPELLFDMGLLEKILDYKKNKIFK